MPIVVQLDILLARRGLTSERVGITIVNLSVLKNGRAKAIRFSTLTEICRVLECQPGELLAYVPEGPWPRRRPSPAGTASSASCTAGTR